MSFLNISDILEYNKSLIMLSIFRVSSRLSLAISAGTSTLFAGMTSFRVAEFERERPGGRSKRFVAAGAF